jgi:AcrR family transcriptional regulator
MRSTETTGRQVPASKRKAPPRNKPGRPEGVGNVRETILDAAEVEFAELGYAGAALRKIADNARVTQALINYYFGTKFGLFEEVFLRRSRQISDERMERLQALKAGGRPIGPEELVLAFLAPTLLVRQTPAGRAFIRLQARLHTEPPEISYKIRNEAYEESTRAYVDALTDALPHLAAKDVYWRMTLMVGAYMYAFSDTHRLEELAQGICNPEDAGEVLAQITAFVVGGLRAPPGVGPA